MSTNQTTNYELNQWLSTDQVLRTDFNADNAKLDATLAAKVDASDLEALENVVDGLTAKDTALESQIAACGNCQLYITSYAGTGTYGGGNPNSVAFPKLPYLAVILSSTGQTMPVIRGNDRALAYLSYQMVHTNYLTWSGSTLSWYTTAGRADSQMNDTDQTYQVLALLAADE
ncbi:MAG: hypothetical protein KH443_05220 [Oscillospiraceae bacterium]|nr:hypothetical protein [Oscillospiraceae bacterium]